MSLKVDVDGIGKFRSETESALKNLTLIYLVKLSSDIQIGVDSDFSYSLILFTFLHLKYANWISRIEEPMT